MKWLLIVVLALTVSILGCNKTGDMNKTGFRCPTCEGEVANDTPRCVHCGQKYNYSDIHPIALDPEEEKKQQEIRDSRDAAAAAAPIE
ncbi:MAG TPA: hypothetical protein EYN70_09450 [Planctomycetaceae bacterium]|jgi:DNA-directed RNA polymerase subunit RPC12/RpoP|nr:hypothetical protein [Planctomycetaceae bacterium]